MSAPILAPVGTEASTPASRSSVSGASTLLQGVSWETYERLLTETENRGTSFAYLEGDLEIVSPQLRHESLKALVDRFVALFAGLRNIPFLSAASTTLKRPDLKAGVEADSSFYFKNAQRVARNRNLDLASDPPPDLAIEIEITSRLLNRVEIYARLGVGEIWTIDGETVAFLGLMPDGRYAEITESLNLPGLKPEVLRSKLREIETMDEAAWTKRLIEWILGFDQHVVID